MSTPNTDRPRTWYYYAWLVLLTVAVCLFAYAWQDRTHWLELVIAAGLSFILADAMCFPRRYAKRPPPPASPAPAERAVRLPHFPVGDTRPENEDMRGPRDEVPPPTVAPYGDAEMVADILSGRCDDALMRLALSAKPARRPRVVPHA